jgi:hypothetical protein
MLAVLLHGLLLRGSLSSYSCTVLWIRILLITPMLNQMRIRIQIFI